MWEDVIAREIPPPTVSLGITSHFLFPALELLVRGSSHCAERAVASLNAHFQSLSWDGECDVAATSSRIVSLLASILIRGDLSFATTDALLKLWLHFFSARGIIEDFLTLTNVWLQRNLSHRINVSAILNSIESHVIFPRFFGALDSAVRRPFYVGRLLDQRAASPGALGDLTARRAAARDGFLYVADPRFGLVKIGTGLRGSVFTALELELPEYVGVAPQSLAAAAGRLFFREDRQRWLRMHDLASLRPLGFVLADGAFAHAFADAETKLPEGPFTAFADQLYFVHDSAVAVYAVGTRGLEPRCRVELRAARSPAFETPAPVAANMYATLVTNGSTIAVLYPMRFAQRQNVTVREFDLRSGELVVEGVNTRLLSNVVAFDETAAVMFDLPDYSVAEIVECPLNFMCNAEFPFPSEECEVPILAILRALPSLFASRLSRQAVSLKQKFVLLSTEQLCAVLRTALELDSEFVVPLAQLLALDLAQFRRLPSCCGEIIRRLLQCNHIQRSDRMRIVRAVFGVSDPIDNPAEILAVVEADMFVQATAMITCLQRQTLVAILAQPRFVRHAMDNFDHVGYAFMQLLTTSITRYVFHDRTLEPSFILPVFHALRPLHSHLFLSVMATMLPVLQIALDNPLSFLASLPVFESFLKEMHSMIPQGALKDYVQSHISVASDQPFVSKTVIDETPHPYQNNMDYVRSYDFPSAIEITVTFDQRTCSETSCDWLQIFTDRDCTRKLTERLSGKLARWKERIVTTAKHLSFKFHSDGSVTDWGYRATICAKIFNRMNFTSPHPAYDVFRTFFGILLKMMKCCDVTKQYIPAPDRFRFKLVDLTRNEPLNLALIDDKFGTSFGDDPGETLTCVQRAMVHHLLDVSDAVDGCADFITSAILGPFAVLLFDGTDLTDHFSNLANLMLFYIPQGIPDSELDFLYKSLKGTKAAEQFVGDSLSFAESAFRASDLTLASICYAANKAALAFQLLSKPNIDSFLSQWFDCLSALSKITTPPCCAFAPNSVETILDFGCMFEAPPEAVEALLRRHLAILASTPINAPNVDVPVVGLIVRRVALLPPPPAHSQVLCELVLTVLRFKLPYLVPLLSSIVDKFGVRLDTLAPVVSILEEVGADFQDDPRPGIVDADEDASAFDVGAPFARARAECIRKMLSDDVVGTLAPLIRAGGPMRCAAMLVLACRQFPLTPADRVVLADINVAARLIAVDPLRCVFRTDEGYDLALPGFNFRSVTTFQLNVDRLRPEPFRAIDKAVADALVNVIDEGELLPLQALTEVALASKTDFLGIFKRLTSPQKEIWRPKGTPKLVEFREMTAMIEQGDQVAFVCTHSLSAYSISLSPFQAQIGFCDRGNSSRNAALLLNCSEKSITFRDKELTENDTIHSVIIGYASDGMRLFLIINRQVKFTDVYLPPMRCPVPLIIVNRDLVPGVTFDDMPLVDLPVFSSVLAVAPHEPSHLFFGDRIVAIESMCAPVGFKSLEPLHLELLPSVSSQLPFYYVEFSFPPELKAISLRPTAHRAFSFYSFATPPSVARDTFGLFIDFRNGIVFATLNGEILNNSVARVAKHDWVITFSVATMETAFVNIGQLPFLFDSEGFAAQPHDFADVPDAPHPPVRTPFDRICPLAPPFMAGRALELTVFTRSQSKSPKSSSLRPCIINSSEKGSYYNGKVGLGRFTKSGTVSLLVANDEHFTWSSVQFPASNVVSLIDHPNADDFLNIYARMVRADPPVFPRGFALDTTATVTATQRLVLLNACMSRIINEIGVELAASELALEEFVVQSITAIRGDDFDPFRCLTTMCYYPIVQRIAASPSPLFEGLCRSAVEPFSLSASDITSTPVNLLCKGGGDVSRVTLDGADAILVVPLGGEYLTQSHVFTDSLGESFVIGERCPLFLMAGDTFEVDRFDENELLLVKLVALDFSRPTAPRLNVRFAVQFISQALQAAIDHPTLFPRVEEHLLRPLWRLHMTASLRIFPGVCAIWFSILFRDFVTPVSKTVFRESGLLSVVIDDQPNILTAVLVLLLLYLRADDTPAIARVVDFALVANRPTYATQVFRQFAAEMVDPFRTRMPFPGQSLAFRPLLTRLATDAYAMARLRAQGVVFGAPDGGEVPSMLLFEFPGAVSVALVRVTASANITFTANSSPVVPDCVVDGSSVLLKISRSTTEPPRVGLLVVPVFPTEHCNMDDLQAIHAFNHELRDRWTADYEAIAIAMVHRARKLHNFFVLPAFPDQLFAIIFPAVSPAAARYRCCLIYLSEQFVGDKPRFETAVIREAFLDLSAVCWPWHEADERELPPLTIHLPITNAKYSDFFFQLGQALDDAPFQALLDIGTSVQSPGTTNILSIDKILCQLTDDMFVEGCPVAQSSQPSKLRAYQAFGTLIASYVLSGKTIPVLIDEAVMAFAFGLTQEVTPEFADAMKAIRLGVYKIELVRPSLRRMAHRPHFCRSCLLRPASQIETVPECRSDHSSFLLSHLMIVPFVRDLLRQNGVSDAVRPLNVEVVDELVIQYTKERHAIVIPSFPAWMRCFDGMKK
jgi:hypothetical protein